MEVAEWTEYESEKLEQEKSLSATSIPVRIAVVAAENDLKENKDGVIGPSEENQAGSDTILVLATQPSTNTDWIVDVQQIIQTSLCKTSNAEENGDLRNRKQVDVGGDGELYSCNLQPNCKRKFYHQTNLQLHQENEHKSPNLGMSLTCYYENCGRRFQWPSHLKYHLLSHRNERAFVCAVPNCGRSFFTAQRLEVHQRSHTGEKPFVCPDPNCGKSFTTNGNLINHKRVHSGEKPFTCEKCGKRFAERSSLKKHSIIHTGKKPFSCDFCGQEFSQTSSRTVHQKRVHPEELALQKSRKSVKVNSRAQPAMQDEQSNQNSTVVIVAPKSVVPSAAEKEDSVSTVVSLHKTVSASAESNRINYLDLDNCVINSQDKLDTGAGNETATATAKNASVIVLSQPLAKDYPSTASHSLNFSGESCPQSVYTADDELPSLEQDNLSTNRDKKLFN